MLTHMRYPNDHNHLFNMLVHIWNIRNGYVLPKIRYFHVWELRNHQIHIGWPILAVPGNADTYEVPKWSPSLVQHVGAYLCYQKRFWFYEKRLLSFFKNKKPPNTHRLTYLSRFWEWWHIWTTQMTTITWSTCWCIFEISRTVMYFPRYVTFIFWN